MTYSNQSVFHLALASRGLAPTRSVREAEPVAPRRRVAESLKAWFVAVTATLFTVVGIGGSLPVG